MRFILALIVVVILIILAGLAVIFSGTFNVAATKEDKGLVRWVLDETLENSVKHHAKGITAPALTDTALVNSGFNRYDQMCAGCHGAPGVSRRGSSRGMNPEPPSLAAVLDEWSPAELFWMTKNGIKMTGMPAFGISQSDEDLWAIVAFLRTLPDVTPEQYLAKREARRAAQAADTTRAPATTANERRPGTDERR